MNRLIILVCILAFFMVFAAAFEGGAASEGEAILRNVCTRCHDQARICAKLGEDEAYWQKTVARMRANGAALGADQITQAARHLSTLAPGAGAVCH